MARMSFCASLHQGKTFAVARHMRCQRRLIARNLTLRLVYKCLLLHHTRNTHPKNLDKLYPLQSYGVFYVAIDLSIKKSNRMAVKPQIYFGAGSGPLARSLKPHPYWCLAHR